MRSLMEKLIDRVPHHTMSQIVRAMQFASGLGMLAYAYLTLHNFSLAFPWFNLGIERASQIIMVIVGLVQVFCGIFHCYRCTCISSWPAAVMFTYVAFCSKFDAFTHYHLWKAAILFAAVNWFVTSISSRRLKREYRRGCATAGSDRSS